MKKYFSIAMMLIVAIMGVAFSSCSKDKDEPAPQTDPSSYCGIWICVSSTDTQNGQTLTDLLKGQTITINADGTYTSTSPAVGKTGRYVLEGNKITATTGGQTIIVTCTFADNYSSMTWDGNANGYTFHYVFQKKKTFSLKVAYTHAVDLGLSVKWADMNVGAQKPEDYGWYLAWGETEEKSIYSSKTYKWPRYDKYCSDDNMSILEPDDDAATVNWGGKWRMPTIEELEELISKCAWTSATQNGVRGCKVTGPNGNSIFLPSTGYREDSSINRVGVYGFYWANTLEPSTFYYGKACYLYCSSNGGVDAISRSEGNCVRPVCL